jgi:CheY-like chemotaxis protein
MSVKKILLVDDSAMARRSARQILESAGYAVAEAEEGLVALARYFLDKSLPVVLGVVMTEMNGLDGFSKLTQMDGDVRVLVLSADVQDSSRQLATEAGAAGFLNKPIDRIVLLNLVAKTLEFPA